MKQLTLAILLFFIPLQVFAFSDISNSSPFHKPIENLIQKGIINGSNTHFNPDTSLSRAELTKVALLSGDIAIESGLTNVFPDLEEGTWQYDVINTAAKHSIVKGFEDGNFYPNNSVTYREGLKIMLNSTYDTIPEVTNDLYLDVKQSDWWAPYVQITTEQNLYNPASGSTFGAGKLFLRKHMAQVIYRRLYTKENNLSSYPSTSSVYSGFTSPASRWQQLKRERDERKSTATTTSVSTDRSKLSSIRAKLGAKK
jgi:hypothetical protein